MPFEPELKLLHEEFLELLKRFHALCVENGIKYSLHGGTLLGAVRDGGFIAWDDDMDAALMRAEYDRLRAAFDRLPPGQELSLEMIDRLPRAVLRRGGRPVVWIDLFIYDFISGAPLAQKCKIAGVMFLSGFKKTKTVFSITRTKRRGQGWKTTAQYTLYHIAYLLGRPFPEAVRYRLFDWFCQSCFCGKRDHIHLANDQYSGVARVLPRAVMDSYVLVPFEDTQLMACGAYAGVLTACYGESYMTPVKYPAREFMAHDIVRSILEKAE